MTVSRLGPGPAFDVPGRGVAWPAAVSVVVTLCPSCSDELAELASEEDPHDH